MLRQAESMPHSIVVTTFRRVRAHGRVEFADKPEEPAPSTFPPRPAVVARMLALAHHLEAAIQRGSFKNRIALAAELGLCDSRVTQVLNLLHLAPDIQDDVLFLEVTDGREPFTEEALRRIARELDWTEQRCAYARLRPGFVCS